MSTTQTQTQADVAQLGQDVSQLASGIAQLKGQIAALQETAAAQPKGDVSPELQAQIDAVHQLAQSLAPAVPAASPPVPVVADDGA